MKTILVISLLILTLVLAACKDTQITSGAVVEEQAETCEDSDGGINEEIQGVVTLGSKDYNDECIAGLLVEYYCEGNSKSNKNIRCPNKCSSGKCA